MKPNKFGIKQWLLADVKTYFILQFQIELGKNCNNSEHFQQKVIGFYVIWSLGEPYLDSTQHLFFDNFFSSVDLMKIVDRLKNLCLWDMAHQQENFPEDLNKLKLVQGEVRTH